MHQVRPNFCRRCGAALSLDGKALNAASARCAACQREGSRFSAYEPRPHRLRVTALGVGLVVGVIAVLLLVVIFAAVSPSSTPGVVAITDTPPVTPRTLPAIPAVPPVPLVPVVIPDPLRDGWPGTFVLHTRADVASIFVNGNPIFRTTESGTFISAPITLRQNDVVVFEVPAPSGVIRAAFVTSYGNQQIPLRAADLRDFGDLSNINAVDFSSYKTSPSAVGKVPEVEITDWENSGAQPAPHGSEFVTGNNPGTYHLGFVVTPQMFRPLKASKLIYKTTYLFDDTTRMAANWRWKANFAMNGNGATGPQEPDNELVSRFMLDGDFTVDLDADFGRAAYTNTGGMLVSVCGKDIGFDGGWNFGSWGETSVHIRVVRLGDELQLIRDGQVLITTVPDDQRGKPTAWRLWWRSRSSHFHDIKLATDRVTKPHT